MGDIVSANGRQTSLSADITEEISDNLHKSSVDIREASTDSIFYNSISKTGFLNY